MNQSALRRLAKALRMAADAAAELAEPAESGTVPGHEKRQVTDKARKRVDALIERWGVR